MTELVLLRTSERRSYKRCRQQWQWSYNERLSPTNTKPALRFGDLIHRSLAAYYIPGRRRGPAPYKTFLDLFQNEDHEFGVWDEDGKRLDAKELGVEMLKNYVAKYGKENHIRIVTPEKTFQIDVTDRQGNYLVTYVGTFDAVFEDLEFKEFGLFEHKTAKSITTLHLPLDDQAGSYFWVANEILRHEGILKKNQELDHILYNFLRKAHADTRPQNPLGQYLNKDGSVSKRQPSPLFQREKVYRSLEDRLMQATRVRAEAWEMAQVRKGKLPIYKNPTRDCGWDCQFRDMCELHESGSDWETYRDEVYSTWDPYDAHELINEDGEEVTQHAKT